MTAPVPDIPPPLPEEAEITSIQAAAKWLVAAASAVFAVLLAGVQLSAVGRLTTEHPLRLVVAIAASVLALGVTAVILGQAVRVLVYPGWTLQKLAHLVGRGQWDHHWLKDELNGQRGMLGTRQARVAPNQLYLHLATLRDAETTFGDQQEVSLPSDLDDPNSPTVTYTSANADALRERVATAEEIARRVAVAANLLETRRRFARLTKTMWIFGVLPVVAIPLFVAATSAESGTRVTVPTAVRVVFADTPNAREAQHDAKLASACAGREVLGSAIGGTFAEPVVVSDALASCRLDRITISPDLGVAYPVHPRPVHPR